MKYLTFFLIIFLAINSSFAQRKSNKKIEINGKVTDANNDPIKGAFVFADHVQTKSKTNKKGIFKLKLKKSIKELAVYSPEYGLLTVPYERKRSLKFRYDIDSKPLKIEDLSNLGYVLKQNNGKIIYSNYGSVLEILDSCYPNVKVIDGIICIGRGVHAFNADKNPLILVDGVPTYTASLSTIPTNEIALINVIDKGSEAAIYGLRAANGVIEIKIKKP